MSKPNKQTEKPQAGELVNNEESVPGQAVQNTMPATEITPMTMLNMAIQKGADMDQVEKLMALQERWEANEARKAYVVAMNEFKKDPPEIFKDRHVSYTTDKGTTEYDHASLSNIVKLIGLGLSKHGLSHRWDINTKEGGMLVVTCVITHELGHSENVPMEAGADASGGKNNIQAKGSTITYLQRYTLLAATGLATAGQDDDGIGAEPVEYITEKEAADMSCLIDEVGANYELFCRFMNVKALLNIKKSDHQKGISALESKRDK
ncbi:MAG: ERF family protein [Devosiaceae bacterium]|nr:ERF family protein [Devosiaceae bacterium]